MSKFKMILKDIIALLVFALIVTILYKQSVFSIMQVAIGVIGVCIAIVVLGGFYITSKAFKDWADAKKNKLKLIFKVHHIVNNKYDTRMIDTIFAYFIHYYDTNAKEIETDREFPIDEFPDGRYDLIKVYQYIKEFRKDNVRLLSKLDYVKDQIFLYGMPFNHITFKIKYNQLHIIGATTDEVMTYLQYSIMRTKIDKALYDLDTEITNWIVKNRNHFGF